MVARAGKGDLVSRSGMLWTRAGVDSVLSAAGVGDEAPAGRHLALCRNYS